MASSYSQEVLVKYLEELSSSSSLLTEKSASIILKSLELIVKSSSSDLI